jgi:regulator of protease activity HflC (stomatin/prohibitin superfamily)
MIKERAVRSVPGIPAFLFLLGLVVVIVGALVWYSANVMGGAGDVGGLQVLGLVAIIAILVAILISMNGLTIVHPNEARALILFGKYFGTLREQGPWWVNPFTERRRISVKIRNFESSQLKVNDHDGNPIAIAAVVVWRVTDTAEALFEVDDYEDFLHIQTEAALRGLATTHPYDAHVEGDIALRSNPQEIGNELRAEVQARLERAGIEVMEARISHLAYAPEIANAMLRRQQATAVIAARAKIVEGAVGMVEMALEALSAKHVVELDEDRKAQMVSNLLVVLCSEHETQPIVNAGTLYS